MRISYSLAWMVMSLGLVSCAVPPIHYYTLTDGVSSVTASEPAASFRIDVLPVSIPVQLDQAGLVLRDGDSGVVVLNGERWASPMADELRSAISDVLVKALDTQDISGLPRPAGQPVVAIKLSIRRFDAWLGQRVELEADWSLSLASKKGAGLTCHGHFGAAAGSGYAGVVGAQQRVTVALANQVAGDVRHWVADPGTGCTPGNPAGL